MPTLRRPTATLHYDDEGPRGAPAVVLLHSLLCDRTMFAHLAADLAATHRVLNLDLRGHGLSSPATQGYTLDDACDDIPALLDHAGVARASLVGLSMGAMLSMRAAVFHPKRVAALALLDTSAEPEAPANRAKYMALAAAFVAVGPTPPIEARVRPLMFSDTFLRASPGEAARLFERLRGASREGVFQAVRAVAMRGDFSRHLGDIRAPAMVLVGDEDRATPMARAERVARGIPGATLEVVRTAGHLSTVEQPELTTHVVRTFLERAAPAGA